MPGDIGPSPSASFCWALDMPCWLEAPAALTPAPSKEAKARTGIPPIQAAVVAQPGNPKAHALTGGPSHTGAAGQAPRKGQARGGPQSLVSLVYS